MKSQENVRQLEEERETIAREAMRQSIKLLPAETAVSAPITPAPSYFGSLLCKRRSVRSFSTKEIPQEKLERLLADCAGGVELVPCATTDGTPFHMLCEPLRKGEEYARSVPVSFCCDDQEAWSPVSISIAPIQI